VNQENWYHHMTWTTAQPSCGWIGSSAISLPEICLDTLKWILSIVSEGNGVGSSHVTNPEKEYYYLAVMARDWLRENPKPYVMRGCNYQGPRKQTSDDA
jgi:hypothetical protein